MDSNAGSGTTRRSGTKKCRHAARLGRELDRSVGRDREREHVDHRRELERAVEVREALAVGELPAQRRRESGLADRQQHEPGTPAIEPIRRREPLARAGEMDERLAIGHAIHAVALRRIPGLARRDVKERHQQRTSVKVLKLGAYWPGTRL